MPRTGARGATIYDVAREARVSVATVSRVMRGTAPVATETRGRVHAAMTDLRFVPNRLGVSLAEGRHAANGIVFPDLTGPYFAEVVLGYEEEAGERGRSVIILSTHGRTAARDRVLDLAGRVDGLVVLGRTVSDEVVAEVAAAGTPVVTLARRAVPGTDTVNADSSHSARELAVHLLEHRYSRVALLGDPAASVDVAARWEGLRAGLADGGCRVVEHPSDGFDVEAGRRAAGPLLGPGATDRPDAVACANDEIALGVLQAAEEHGLRVPEDLAVTGWDDVMAARWAGLTTVRQPMRELGARAARVLDDRMRGLPSPHQQHTLPTHVIVRRTCGTHPQEDPC